MTPRPLAACLLTLAGLVGCGGGESTHASARVLLVGIDGATLRVAQPLLEAGALPHLSRIAEEGVAGPLRSLHPLFSPRIWASIATGVVPEKHGIEGFAYEDASGARHLYQSFDRKVHALWNIASEAGLEVAVVNWWTTYPPEDVAGVVVSDHAARHAMGGAAGLGGPFVSPPGWEERVTALLAQEGAPAGWRDPFRNNRDLPEGVSLEALSDAFRTDAAVVRAALAIEEATRPDLLMVFLKGIDRVSHRLFPALEPPEEIPAPLRLAPRERDAAVEALHAYYTYTDALIGLLAARFAPGDLVMVVSDHGFETRVRRGKLRGEHRSAAAENGVLFARGRGIAPGGRAEGASVLDVTPTILAWLGLPVAEDMDGAPAAFVEVERVRHIPTYETRAVPRRQAAPSELEPQILEELEQLGYFED